MNTLEEFVRKNRDEFDDREPSEGHLERFSFKLATRLHSGRNKKSILPYILKAAVITLLVTLSSLWTFDHVIRPNLKKTMTLSDVSSEYREVETYYVSQVNMIENDIMAIDLDNPEQKQIMMQELAGMDSTYAELQKELKANPDDKRIIDAMITHYQTKIEVLNYILNQLREIKEETENSGSHEKVAI